MDVVQRKKFIDAVERVLHVKGNYAGGILEMTVVIDCSLEQDYVSRTTADLVAALRSHSEIFRNVRLNLTLMKSDERLENRVIPISFLQMKSCFADYRQVNAPKSLDALAAYLKLYHARSKLILVLADARLDIRDQEAVRKAMHPFLGKKSIFRYRSEAGQEWMRGEELLNL